MRAKAIPGQITDRLEQRAGMIADQVAGPSSVQEILRSPGHPIDATTRSVIEPRLGHDFSTVRLHTDAKVSESAVALRALAFWVTDVFAPTHRRK